MAEIQSARIQRFKNIDDAHFELADLNVLVGANNSGKSSVIQALHFAIGLLQTIDVAERWPAAGREDASVSVYPNQPLYSPSEDLYSLAAGGRLTESAANSIGVTLTLDSGHQVSVQVRKGRNRNATVAVQGVTDAKRIGNIERPFSVFSPGLAGVSKTEAFVSDGVLLRTIARGDSNLVLRNILYRLWKERDTTGEWHEFLQHLHSMFPSVDFRVRFRSELDEFIHVDVNVKNAWVPIELSGTGVLQATQILAYVHHFSPRLVVLDEPDSHLHPNNQRLLCGLLEEISSGLGTQVILTTHSRHVVDALSGSARFHWLRGGAADRVEEDDEIGVLLDIGALDVKERLAVPGMKAVVLTEDKDTRLLEAVVGASGFDMAETVVLPYYGVSNISAVKPLLRIIRQTNPNAVVLVHRDRDYWTDDDINAWEASIRREACTPFATPGVDLEAMALEPSHLAELNEDLDELLAAEVIAAARAEVRDRCVAKYVNGRIDCERKAQRGGEVDAGQLAVEAHERLYQDPDRFYHGKLVLAAARRHFRERFPGHILRTHHQSTHLAADDLVPIGNQVFGQGNLDV